MLKIGARIKERRQALGMSQAQLGEAVKRGKSAVSEWEADKRSPDIDLIFPLAKTLQTTPTYLMGLNDDPEDYEEAPEMNYLPVEWYDHFNGDVEAAVKAYRAMEDDRAQEAQYRVSDADLKFALFGGDKEITDKQFEEVKRYARYLKERGDL